MKRKTTKWERFMSAIVEIVIVAWANLGMLVLTASLIALFILYALVNIEPDPHWRP